MTILLVEDDDVDAIAVRRAFRKIDSDVPVIRAKDGQEALDYFYGEDTVYPSLVLLDLNMPRVNGHEFLRAIRADEKFENTLVIILSTSDSDSDINACYEQGVVGYFMKSTFSEAPVELAQWLTNYTGWNQFPAGHGLQ